MRGKVGRYGAESKSWFGQPGACESCGLAQERDYATNHSPREREKIKKAPTPTATTVSKALGYEFSPGWYSGVTNMVTVTTGIA